MLTIEWEKLQVLQYYIPMAWILSLTCCQKHAKRLLAKKYSFGVGLVENAADETAIAEIVHVENIFSREIELQKIAKNYMPRLLFDEIDVLVIDQIGKNISGAGMDPNITGRNSGGLNGT